jgi:hypothetical protein
VDEKIKEIKEWAKNITKNYNDDVDIGLLSQLIDACHSLRINVDEMDQRWQFFVPKNRINYKDIMYLLGF